MSGRQVVPTDPFAWEVAEHEEARARLWAAIYAVHAELLAVERLLSLDADRRECCMHAMTAAWRWAQASIEATGYAAAFGTGSTTAHGRDHCLCAYSDTRCRRTHINNDHIIRPCATATKARQGARSWTYERRVAL